MEDQKLLEEGDPSIDVRLFRRCLGQFGTGVAIVTTHHEGQSAGMTVNSVASVSLNPPLVLWSIRRDSRSFPIFEAASGFAISILSKNQLELSRHFSSAATDKFSAVSSTSGRFGIPLIHGAITHIECSREASYSGGDHVIQIGRATNVRRYGGDPLLFVQGRFVVQADHPDALSPPGANGAAAKSRQSPETNLIPLIFEVHHSLSAKFEEHRAAEGINPSVARILAAIKDSPGITLDTLSRRTYLDGRDAEDALVGMKAKGLVTQAKDGSYSLTEAGSERREAIRRRWLHFQAEELAGIPQSEIESASKTLSRLYADKH